MRAKDLISVFKPGVMALVAACRPKPPATTEDTRRVWDTTASNKNSPDLDKYVEDPAQTKPKTWS